MRIAIVQGCSNRLPRADVNVVIDVIRVLTFARMRFKGAFARSLFAGTVAKALALRAADPELLLGGEVGGLAVAAFDPRDIEFCAQAQDGDFVMRVHPGPGQPAIGRVQA